MWRGADSSELCLINGCYKEVTSDPVIGMRFAISIECNESTNGPKCNGFSQFNEGEIMIEAAPLVFAAIEYSIAYMLLGGGFFGAVIIFFVAKMLGR